MVQDNTWFESSDGTKLYLRRWSTAKTVAVLHIVHGMAEHSERYGRLAEKLCGAGIEVWAADQRGHGKTADININNPGKGGILGHCADKDTFERVTADVHGINEKIRTVHPSIPLFMLGHSWGSFILQNYIENENSGLNINGCILSGTRGPDGFKIKSGIPFMSVLAAICGKRKGSQIARAIADGPYNQPFRPNRTDFDWISRDEAEVDAYVKDPLCGYLCSTGFYRDLAKGLYRIHQPETMGYINRNLPIYIFSGSADPVGDMGASPTKLVNAYCILGIKDLEFVLYPGARHETLNETNREEVINNLLSWICRHAGYAELPQSTTKTEK
jgi:alpha-beta hydrolase superfamily lysophospholipase